MSGWAFFGALVGLLALCTAVHIAAIALTGYWLGARVVRVSFGVGPHLRHTWRNIEWELGPVPLGGSVSFFGTGQDAFEEHGAFVRLSRLRRTVISASGCAGLLLLALVTVGPEHLRGSLTNAFRELGISFLALGRSRPLADPVAATTASVLPRLWSHWASLVREAPASALGVLAAKTAAFNLLPLPPLNGLAMLLEPLQSRTGPRIRVPDALQFFSLALLLALCASISWSAARYVLGH
jgi:membrane-associated protease RseP (regulator of RpoE activity)